MCLGGRENDEEAKWWPIECGAARDGDEKEGVKDGEKAGGMERSASGRGSQPMNLPAACSA